MGRQQSGNSQLEQRPKRRATNAHIFRYLQTRNPSKLEENDLKRALEASLEECPDFWPQEDSASCSSSEQTSSLSSRSSSSNASITRPTVQQNKRVKLANSASSSMQQNHLNQHNHMGQYHHSANTNSFTATINNCCPNSTVHKRYKPVAKKNIYNEADFFHAGIMEYIEYELFLAHSKKEAKKREKFDETEKPIKLEKH